MSEQSANVTIGLNRHSLEGSVVYACRKCRAPGCYSNSLVILEGWPACYDPLRHGQQVGDICPQCNSPRPMNKELGELSSSMPRWIWTVVLGFKWLLIKWKTFRSWRRYNEA